MVISELVLLGTFWYLLKSLPGLMQSVGYLFGLLLDPDAYEKVFFVFLQPPRRTGFIKIRFYSNALVKTSTGDRTGMDVALRRT